MERVNPPPSKRLRERWGSLSAIQRVPFTVEHGDSLSLLGMRKTGKTVLGRSLYQRLMDATPHACGYILDSNASGDFSGWPGGYFGYDCPIIAPTSHGRQVVWQPPKDDANAYEDFFARLYEARIAAILLIDELSALGGGGDDKHEYYARLLKRGRRRNDFPGITVISLTQEMAQSAKVPRQTFSQMTHFFRFYVQHPYDLLEANRKMHLPGNVQPEHPHGFWHARMDNPPIKPTYYRGSEVVFRV